MQTQKRSPLNRLSVPLLVAAISLLAASCNDSKPSDLQRPISDANEISNIVTDATSNTNSNPEDNGEVAGLETVTLPTKSIKIGEATIETEIADTDESRTQGLSNRKRLDEGKGMLFDFTNTDFKKPGFWMKDMLISIDMIWIYNGKIIGITTNVPIPPEDRDLEVYYPPSEITHVLEVPAGWSAKNNLKVGDPVNL